MGRKPKHAGDLEGPYFVRFMAPILDCLREKGDSANASEVVEWVGDKFGISDEQREERQKNGVK